MGSIATLALRQAVLGRCSGMTHALFNHSPCCVRAQGELSRIDSGQISAKILEDRASVQVRIGRIREIKAGPTLLYLILHIFPQIQFPKSGDQAGKCTGSTIGFVKMVVSGSFENRT